VIEMSANPMIDDEPDGPAEHELTDHDLADTVIGASHGKHAFENCVERLATAIRLGVYPYGTRLPPERELAALMGVSRATLREAIAALRTAGMVRTTRGRRGGTIVNKPPATPGQGDPSRITDRRSELMDSLVFRRVVEPGACAVAASKQLTPAQESLITDALRTVRAATNPAEHRQADSRLHLAIASLTESPAIVDAVRRVQADLHDMLVAIPVLSVNIEHSNAQHDAIVEAIIAGDPIRARRVMESHCDDTAALLRGLLG
jgi:GntR family transcriptional repressor for pyruvate dehydrogenase complex